MKGTSMKGRKFEPKTNFWAHWRELQCQWQKEFWVYTKKILSGLPIIWETIRIRAALEVTISLKTARYGFKITIAGLYDLCTSKFSSSCGNNNNPKASHRIPWKINSTPVSYNSSAPKTSLSLRRNPSLFQYADQHYNWCELTKINVCQNNRVWKTENKNAFSCGWWEELTPFVILKIKNALKGNLLSRIMEKGGWQKNLQSNG